MALAWGRTRAFHDPLHDLRGGSRWCRNRVGRARRRRRVPRRTDGASPMSGWTADELARIGGADELRIASRRSDGSLRPFITIWAVRDGDDLYVRSAHGYDNPWFQRALHSGAG